MRFKILFIFLFGVAIGNAQDTIGKLIPNKLLFKKNIQHSFSISPNGKFFVEVIENNIENDIVIIDIDNYVLHQRIPIGKGKIQNVYWLNDNRLIYESMGEIIAIDIDGTNSALLVGRMAEKLTSDFYNFHKNFRFNSLISLYPENKNEIIIETYGYDGYSTLKRVNVFTGQKVVVLDGKYHKINKWIVDYSGNIRFGLRYENDESFTYYTLNNETEKWVEFSIHINDQELPLKVSANSYLNQNISFEGFGFDNDIIYLTTNYDSDKRKLLSYNLKEKRVVEILLEDDYCDIADPHGEGISLIFDSVSAGLAGVRYQSMMPKYKWFSSDFEATYTKLNEKYPSLFNDIIDSDIDNTKLLIYQWSDISEGNIGVYNTKTGEYAIMFHFNQELDQYKLTRTKSFKIEARDGWEVPCYLNLPNDYAELESVPLVVIPHGGPWARDYWMLDDFSQYFTNHGFAVLRTNFRGSTGFGKKHLLAGVSSIDEVMINDIADATKYIIGKCKIKKNGVFVFGHSYGGYATYMSLIKYPDIYSKGVALSAPTDLKEWMKTQKKEKNYFAYEFWNTALGSNSSKYLNSISPICHVQELRHPVLIFHGKKDEIISAEQAQEMTNQLKKYNSRVRLEILQNEGHSINDSNSLGYILDTSREFFSTK